MLSVVHAALGVAGGLHSHSQEQWGVVLKGSGVRVQDGEEHPEIEVDLWRTPGGVEHGSKAGPDDAVVLDTFALPRDEYRRAGAGFGGGAEGG